MYVVPVGSSGSRELEMSQLSAESTLREVAITDGEDGESTARGATQVIKTKIAQSVSQGSVTLYIEIA